MSGSGDADLAMIMSAMRESFVTDARDKIEAIDDALDLIDTGTGQYENHVLDIQRVVHSIKGGAGSFGFMSVSRIAHAFEDFVEIMNAEGKLPVRECRRFVQTMDQILSSGQEPSEEEAVMLMDQLPVPHHHNTPTPEKMRGKAAVLMPKGLQRKIMAQELTGLGFRVVMADDVLQLLDASLSGLPDIVVTTMVLDRMSGADLARVLSVIDRTRHIRVAILTSDAPDDEFHDLPADTAVIRKGPTMARDFMSWLQQLGIV